VWARIPSIIKGMTLVNGQAAGRQLAPLAQGSSPALRVTISGNRPRCGYVSCLMTQALWQRIVSLMSTPVTAIPDSFRDRFSNCPCATRTCVPRD
jgi:hypothetical protein